MGIHYPNTNPKPGDVNNVLLGKILQRLAGSPELGDHQNHLLRKILEQLNGFASPGDTDNVVLQKILDAFAGGGDCPECEDNGGFIFGPNPENIQVISAPNNILTTNLTSRFPGNTFTDFSFGRPVTASAISFANSTLYTSIVFRMLQTASGGISVNGCSALHTWVSDLLEDIGSGGGSVDFDFTDCVALANLSAAALDRTAGGIFLNNTPAFNTPNPFPLLREITGVNSFFFVTGSLVLETFVLPSFESTESQMGLDEMAVLTTFLCPKLVTTNSFFGVTASPMFANFSAPLWLPTDGQDVDFSDCALTETSVNHILARCVAAGLTTSTINLSGGSSASPAGQGAADAATLSGNGCTVVTN